MVAVGQVSLVSEVEDVPYKCQGAGQKSYGTAHRTSSSYKIAVKRCGSQGLPHLASHASTPYSPLIELKISILLIPKDAHFQSAY